MADFKDLVRSMIEDALNSSEWTSASPEFTNRIKKVTFSVEPDFAAALDELLPTTEKGKEDNQTKETIGRYQDSGVEDVSRFTQAQVGNLTSFVQNPFGFVVGTFSRALVRGAGVGALIIGIGKLVETFLNEWLRPGRPGDVRFREIAQDEILKFTDAREQAEIRSGISRHIIVSTIGGLRGDAARGNIGGNFYTPARVPKDRIDPSVVVAAENQSAQGLGSSIIKTRGAKRFNR